MLNNLSWDKPQQDILSLDSLIGWLETKPRFGTYAYYNARNCMLAQYFRSKGIQNVSLSRESYYNEDTYVLKNLPEGWNDIAKRDGRIGFLTLGRGFFGTSLRRARKLRAKRAAPNRVEASEKNISLLERLVLDRP
jgi:hypothetical protein